MIVLKRKFFNIGQAWFAAPDPGSFREGPRVDVMEYIQCPKPDEPSKSFSEFHTLIVDLSQPTEQMNLKIHKDTQYEIRRAGREALVFKVWTVVDEALLTEFCNFYDDFAAQKKRGSIGRDLMTSYAEAGALTLSSVTDSDGKNLTWHAYLVSGERARLLQSASHYRLAATPAERSKVGRANRFHHWQDLLHFKASGLRVYDFGGWYNGTSDIEKLNINKFKEEFGGVPAREYGYTKALTLTGKIYFLLNPLRRLFH